MAGLFRWRKPHNRKRLAYLPALISPWQENCLKIFQWHRYNHWVRERQKDWSIFVRCLCGVLHVETSSVNTFFSLHIRFEFASRILIRWVDGFCCGMKFFQCCCKEIEISSATLKVVFCGVSYLLLDVWFVGLLDGMGKIRSVIV